MALTQQQLNERKNFIGSSEAKIIASGDFKSWAKLISEKKGESEPLISKQLQFMFDAGNHLESFVLDAFGKNTKLKVGSVGQGRTVAYMKHNVSIICTLEQLIIAI